MDQRAMYIIIQLLTKCIFSIMLYLYAIVTNVG